MKIASILAAALLASLAAGCAQPMPAASPTTTTAGTVCTSAQAAADPGCANAASEGSFDHHVDYP